MAARIAKAAKDAKTGRKATERIASKINKEVDNLKNQLKKLDKRKEDPGGSLPMSRVVKYKSNKGQQKINPVQSKNRNSQRTELKGIAKGVGGAAAVGAGVAAVNKATNKKKPATAVKKTTTPKKLPLAKEGKIDVVGSGKGMKYYQNGKQVRIK